ncbi:unnamed protein product [Adineta ricciae]|uniref:U-box domain-containing protein n=1 Tax=Adineta ricciae TaxID=249248 RepID=A0A814QA26_ADIRI|nr:unnamed protein product [Adineta ricciae]
MSIPDEYLCPITRDVMKNPVLLIEDGYSYEENALKSWLENHNTSPMTNNFLKNRTFISNRALKSLINDFLSHKRITSEKLSREFLSFKILTRRPYVDWKSKPTITIILSVLGPCQVGKTILSQCLQYGHWPANMPIPPSTIGCDLLFYHLSKLFKEQFAVALRLNDPSGQDRFESVTNLYFRQCHGALFLTDMTNPESLERLEQYWYPRLKQLSINPVEVILVCTKLDLFEKQEPVYREAYLRRVEQFATKHQIPIVHVSAYRGDNIEYLFKRMIIQIMENDELIDPLVTQALSCVKQKSVKKTSPCCL